VNNESDVNLNIHDFDKVLSYWFPMRRSSHAGASKEDQAMKEAWEGQGPTECKCGVARGVWE
jgi:hypothetical protein